MLKLRAELFDKRFQVYEATVQFLSFIMRKAAAPEPEGAHAYFIAMDRSRLLFDETVYGRLKSIWDDMCKLGLAGDMLDESRAGYAANDRAHWAEVKASLLVKFAAHFDNPSTLFGEHLRLGEVAPGRKQ